MSFDPSAAAAQPMPPASAPPAHWSLATRLAFRFGFCYLMMYALCCGNATLWEVIPFHVGEHLEEWTSWPFSHGAQSVASNARTHNAREMSRGRCRL